MNNENWKPLTRFETLRERSVIESVFNQIDQQFGNMIYMRDLFSRFFQRSAYFREKYVPIFFKAAPVSWFRQIILKTLM